MYETVLIERRDNLAIVTLNRPQALNAFNSPLRRDVTAALGGLNAEPQVRGIVLTGAGDRAFSAGIDLKEAQHVQMEQVESWFGEMRDVYQSIRLLDKPVVTALNGIAAGAGFQIALASDIRVGHPGTRMGQPEINAGVPSIMGAFWMSLHLGLARNVELSLTGRLMDAEECHRIGLLNHLVPAEALLPKALEIAGELAAKPPTAMRYTKRRFREVTQAAFDEAFQAGVAGQRQCYREGEPQAMMGRFVAEREARKGR